MRSSSKHDPTKEPREFLTARQLASVLQISEATVRRLAHDGRIPSVRLTPRLIRFRLATVRAALDRENRLREAGNEPYENPAQLTFEDILFETRKTAK